MSSLLTFLMFVILLACLAMCYADGMWSNAIRLINVVTSALLAMNFFEPIARWLEGWQSAYTYLWDFVALWAVFFVSMAIFRVLTDKLSRVKVRFLTLADRIGSGVLSVWIGWVMIMFTMTTLHTAPLAKNFMFEGFQPEERMFLGLGPDRTWLGFTQRMSMGAFSCSPENAFDPDSEYMPKYQQRRVDLEKHIQAKESLLVGS
ncbi:MAG: CvpA family protein [Planctomycetaceae bacterium]|nr:CvpA family protein [Planctomycetaceae bacterium]